MLFGSQKNGAKHPKAIRKQAKAWVLGFILILKWTVTLKQFLSLKEKSFFSY